MFGDALLDSLLGGFIAAVLGYVLMEFLYFLSKQKRK